ncbi:putative Ig domain-containing protein [Staphylococcus simiae]|uniref:Ig-like domain-containing protein n=1 Tax=Staphylococcus simiae TaxID=308354 RepID=UPI001A982459|nr:Ig-like domain-containing protein [Staphylococcus simiae]MBO1198874.1 putative Ig domain-containing protein [Staphylococcus simiae]MBO1201100.1 putative Ig domain-containing protein [Staphylococcus simiae]MBO1229438.1 putative Ig domain-containing protein [Staphylococcus simiae]
MKNKQGFLPNRLNKYAIRKFTVGTASLLIGATLVFGVENVAKADELDNSSAQNKDSNKDKSEPVDITELTDSSITNNNDKATTTSTEATTTVESNSASTSNEMTTTNTDDKESTGSAEQDTTSSDKTSKQQSSSINQGTIDNTTDNNTTQDTTPTHKTTQNDKDSATNKTTTTNDKQASQDTTKVNAQHKASKAKDKETTEVDENANKSDVTADKNASTKDKKVVKSKQNSNTAKAKSDKKVAQTTKTKVDNKATKQQSNKTTKKVASKHDTTLTNNTELAKKLAKSKDKATAVNAFLKEHVSESEAKDILNNTDVDFNKASDEEINQAVLQAALIELANKQQSTETLATAPRVRTFMRAMTMPVMYAAAEDSSEDSSENVQKSLGYSDNYTFASLVFAPGTLDSDAAKAKNYIPFDIHAYMSGSNSGQRYKIDLKLDEKIAKHVTKITVNPPARSTPVEFVRLTDDSGNPSNIWEVNYIRASGGLFGGAEILKTYSATNGRIELDDTVGNILNEAGNLSNNKLNYQVYVRDSNNNTIIRTSESGGYFLTTTDSDLAALNNNKSTANSDAFRASSGTAVLDTTVGTNGAIIVDQQIVKSGTFGYGGGQNKQWSYNYQIDKDLIPFIESVELDRYDYNGLSGFDKTYNASNKVADLKIDANGKGTITASDLNNLIEFNNGLPEPIGIRVVIKLNQSANNILTKDAQYDSNGNLITSTTDRLEDFTFAGYLTDNAGKLINNTLGTTSLGLQDYDQDGLLDSYEREVSLTDPNNKDTDSDGKNDGDEVKKYLTSPLVGTPQVADITINDTKVSGSVPLQPNAGSQTAKVINPAGQVIGTSAVNSDGTFTVTIPKSAAGQYTIAIDDANYQNDETSTFNIIDNTIVPAPIIDPVDDNDTTIGVRGTAGSTITVKDSNNNVIGTVTLGANSTTGTLTLTKPLTAGTQLTSTATKNGKTSAVSPTVTVTDATAPDAPVINRVTSEDTTVKGTAEPNSTVAVTFPDGTTQVTAADSSGNYTVNIPSSLDLTGGEVIKATATDAAGNKSVESNTTVVDTTAPSQPTVNRVTSEDTTITGKAEPNSTVTVTFPNGTTVQAITTTDGSYRVAVPTNIDLKGGENLTVTATDKAGNTSTSANTTVVDVTPPAEPTINTVTSEDKTITGKAEPNSTVTITFPDGTTATGTTDQNGNYTVSIPNTIDLKGDEELSAIATDAAGNKSVDAGTTVLDKTAPDAPTVNPVTSEDTTITGKSEPFATITVTFPDGTTATGTADEDGNYVVDIPINVDLKGGETLPVTSTDEAGNESSPANTVVTDTTAPTAPTVNPVTSEDKTITGKAEPNSTVIVTFPDGTTATGTTDEDGNYVVDIPTNVDLKGGETLPVTSTDEAGNESSPANTVVTDTTAPTAPTVNPVTSEDKTITGKAEPNSTVTVTFPDGTTATGTADEDGNYVIDIPTNVDLKGGETLPVTSTDEAGNESSPANTVVTDTTAPTAPTVNPVTSEDKTITGKAEPNSTVTVTFPDGTTATGTTDEDGNYVVDIPTNVDLKGGETLPVTSTDEAGNESQPANTVVTDTTAPTAPTVNPVTSEDKTITGKAEPNSTVTVTFPDGTTATGTADEDGNYVIDIPTNVDLKGGETLPVTSTDEAGNVSDPASTVVTDTTAPTVPTVNPVTSEDKTITGKAEPNSTVTVTFPDGTTATGTADEDGNYVIDIPTNVDLKGGETLPVTSTDEAGNESSPANTVVTDTTAPIVKGIDDQTKEVNTPIDEIKIEADDGVGHTLTNSVSGLPTGVTFDEATNTISGSPTTVGTYPVTVTTTDAEGNSTTTQFTITVVDTTAPTVKAIDDQTKEVNTPIDSITIDGQDNSGQPVKNSVSGLPAGVTFDETTNTISGSPTTVGTYPVTVTTTDAEGNTTTTKFTITVVDTTAPTVKDIDDQTKEVNTPIDNIVIDGSDNSGQAVKNSVSGLPAGVTFDENTNTISGSPTTVGTYPVTVTTTDAEGNTTTTKFTITVVDTTAPTVKDIDDQTKEVNTPIDSITIDGQDNSGQPVTNSVSGLPAGVTFDENTNTISGSPTTVGTYPVTVTTTDAEGNTTTTQFTITVVDTTAPTVKAIDDQTKEVNTSIDNIIIDGSDNSGQPVKNSVSGLPTGVTFDPETNTISGSPTTVGTYPVTVTTTDAEGNTTTTKFTITVVDTTAPTVKDIDDQTKEVNTPIDNIVIDGQDNSGQPVTNSVSGLPAGVTFDPETNTISGSPTTVGTYPVTVTTTDAEGNSTTTQFTITVVDTTAPTVKAIDDQTKEVNTPIDNIVIDSSDNSGQPVKNSVSGLPAGVTFNPETNTISGSPTAVGKYPVTVTTTDAEGNTTTTKFTITVVDTTAPTVKAIDDQTKEVNTPIDNIVIDSSDNSGQPVKNSVSGLPAGVTFNPETNTISGSPTTVGKYPVTVTTTDAEGNSTTTQFTITVVDTTAPTVKAIDDQTKEVNTPIDNIIIDGQDNSGQPVTNSVSGLPAGVTFDPETNTISGSPTTVGTYPVTVTTIDAEGNTTTTKFTITVVDTTAPDAPTINPVHKGDTTITGKAEPNSTVTITFPDGTTATGTTDADGNYTIDVPSNVHLNGGDHIDAIATDKSGNDSPAADTIVIDDSKPVDPDHPTDPTDPTDPVKPTDPSHPTKPNQPTQPSQPGTVVPPSTPKNDKPSNDNHINPEPSQQQNTSDSNITPTQNNHKYSRQERIYNESVKTDHKKENSKANKQQSELPETGDSGVNNGTLFGSLLAGLGALFLFFKRRKEDEEEEEQQ